MSFWLNMSYILRCWISIVFFLSCWIFWFLEASIKVLKEKGYNTLRLVIYFNNSFLICYDIAINVEVNFALVFQKNSHFSYYFYHFNNVHLVVYSFFPYIKYLFYLFLPWPAFYKNEKFTHQAGKKKSNTIILFQFNFFKLTISIMFNTLDFLFYENLFKIEF